MVTRRIFEPSFSLEEVAHRQQFLMTVSHLLRLGHANQKVHNEGKTAVQNRFGNQARTRFDGRHVSVALFPAHHRRRIVRNGHDLDRRPGQPLNQILHVARLLSIQRR